VRYESIGDYLKNISSDSDKLTKSETTYSLGNKISEMCNRILALTKNEEFLEKELSDVEKNLQKLVRKSNRDSSYRVRQAGILEIYLQKRNLTNQMAVECFSNANDLMQKKKHQEAIYYTETAIRLNEKLGNDTELRNIGMFTLNAGDRVIREGRITEAMDYYEFSVEAFDKAGDEESSSRLINTILQTREWDADLSIGFKCYRIAAESAIRLNNYQKAHDIATKCFNRGAALIDQPRIPVELSQQFIDLAGKTFEDIGAIKEAANCYDSAILRYLPFMKVKKNIEPIIGELLVKIAVNRMAACDMDSLETIYLRVKEMAELKKAKYMKDIATVLNFIRQSKIEEAWNKLAALPFVSHGRIRRIMDSTKNLIISSLAQKGIFDRTIFSTTDRSLPLSDYLLQLLINTNKIEGQPINKDVFISHQKLWIIRNYFNSEYTLWGRVEIDNILKEYNIQQIDAISIIRREFLSTIYMGMLNNTQKIFFSGDRIKAELSLLINKEKKKDAMFDPMQAANKMQISPDILKEIIREIACEEVVEKALQT
ncbi:MAG: hypothetical protein ACFFDW_16810, partial [Candidatus Thorarchaeota archaeon]